MASHRDELPLLRHALELASSYPIFPVSPRGKTPAFEGWQDQATQDPQQIRAWFRQRPYNIGVVTGRPSLFVIDLDTAPGSSAPEMGAVATRGCDVLASLARESGHPYPGNTFTVSTPTGGMHLYFVLPEGVSLPNSSRRLGALIDTRGRGGLVVGPGSVRPQGRYRVSRQSPVAVLPDWLIAALTPPPPPLPAAMPAGLSSARLIGYVATPLREECAAVAAATTGNRHRILLRAARILGEFVGAAMLDQQVARAALREAYRAHIGVDGFTEHQAERAVSDGIAYGARRPRTPGGR